MQTASALHAVDETPTTQEVPEPEASSPAWGIARRYLFRFWCSYMLLYSFPFPIYYVPLPFRDKIFGWYFQLGDMLVTWAGKQVFNVDISLQPNGSGDSTYSYVQVFCYLLIAIFAALVWSVLDRKRAHYR